MNETRKVFAIGDLHLPGGADKPMDLFGSHWQDHFSLIQDDWQQRVGSEDIVLIPGDISWAMRLEDALPDLRSIGQLPGHKILIKGNHDFWWSSLSQVRDALLPKMYAIQNDAIRIGNYVFCGSRGWVAPGAERETKEDQKIYQRELGRLELSLKAAQKLGQAELLFALCHYPPFGVKNEESAVTNLLESYGVNQVVYGHLHAGACAAGFQGERNGVRYTLVSCDCLLFKLVELEWS